MADKNETDLATALKAIEALQAQVTALTKTVTEAKSASAAADGKLAGFKKEKAKKVLYHTPPAAATLLNVGIEHDDKTLTLVNDEGTVVVKRCPVHALPKDGHCTLGAKAPAPAGEEDAGEGEFENLDQ